MKRSSHRLTGSVSTSATTQRFAQKRWEVVAPLVSGSGLFPAEAAKERFVATAEAPIPTLPVVAGLRNRAVQAAAHAVPMRQRLAERTATAGSDFVLWLRCSALFKRTFGHHGGQGPYARGLQFMACFPLP